MMATSSFCIVQLPGLFLQTAQKYSNILLKMAIGRDIKNLFCYDSNDLV